MSDSEPPVSSGPDKNLRRLKRQPKDTPEPLNVVQNVTEFEVSVRVKISDTAIFILVAGLFAIALVALAVVLPAERWEKIAIFGFGGAILVTILVIAIRFPHPTSFQYTVFRIVLAIAAAGVAALIPGFIDVTVSDFVRAGGALAVFAVVYFFSPAALRRLEQGS